MTAAERVLANETIVPMMPCTAPEETLGFWRAMGCEVTYEQTKPYLYLAFRLSGFELHYCRAARDGQAEPAGGCLVMVDAVAPYHVTFVEAMRQAYGKVLATGLPRITRYRPGASRFTVYDPSGNSVIFIRRDEPKELPYGGSKELQGLAKVLDNARILRDFKNDDRAAFRALDSGLRRHAENATALQRATVLASLIELSVSLGEDDKTAHWGELLRQLSLTTRERQEIRSRVSDATLLTPWLPNA